MEAKDINGCIEITINDKKLISVCITKGLLKKINELFTVKQTHIERIEKQMVILFGEDKNNYDDYTMSELNDILGVVGRYIENPGEFSKNPT